MKPSSGRQGTCPACSRVGAFRYVVCDSCWRREVWPKLGNLDQTSYLRRIEAALS